VIATADVIVVGGGINGSSVAYHLARRGADTVLVDSPAARSATPNSAAVFSCFYASLGDSLLAAAGLQAFRCFRATVGEAPFWPTGVVSLLPAGTGQAVAGYRGAGVPVDQATVDELRGRLPGADLTDVESGAVEPDGGYTDPGRCLQAYQAAARQAGARIIRTAVTGVVTARNTVVGLDTTVGRIAGGVTVVAAGHANDGLLRGVGVVFPLSARRVNVAAFDVTGSTRWPVVLDIPRGTWFRPDGTNRVLVGLEWGDPVENPDRVPDGVDDWFIGMCRERLVSRFPGVGQVSSAGGWSGVVSMSADGRPVVDRLAEVEGMYCIAGDSGRSFKTAPVVGDLLAAWIMGGPPDPLLASLRRDRPATDDPRERLAAGLRLARDITAFRRRFNTLRELS
jgi:sarcosine oxidase subunit beta